MDDGLEKCFCFPQSTTYEQEKPSLHQISIFSSNASVSYADDNFCSYIVVDERWLDTGENCILSQKTS